jgi:diguanylate cyclase (GGDEF)-like protein
VIKKLFETVRISKEDYQSHETEIKKRIDMNNAKHALFVLFTGIIIEITLILVYDIPNIIKNGWVSEFGLYYLLAHTMLLLVSIIGTISSFKKLYDADFVLFRYIKFEKLIIILVFLFLGSITVINGLDQNQSDSISLFAFFTLITAVFVLIKPKIIFYIFGSSYLIFIIGLVLFQSNPEVLLSNLINGTVTVIVSFFVSYIIYNNFLAFTLVSIKLEESTKQLEILSTTDSLTKVFNRRKLEENLLEEISRSKRLNNTFCLLMFDIDHFKKVNDQYGHPVGDKLLIALAEHISSQIRYEDTFARYGGEEFILVLSNTALSDAKEKAEHLRKSISEIVIQDTISVTISIGITQFQKEDNLEQLLTRVDKALYNAKESGRNKVTSL